MFQSPTDAEAQPLPSRDIAASERLIVRIQQDCADHVRDRRYRAVVELGSQLSTFINRSHSADQRLLAVRMAEVDALLRLGDGHAARERLRWIEGFHGASGGTRELMARILSYQADHAGCLDACSDAVVARALDRKTLRPSAALMCLRAESLRLLGRPAEARRYLVQGLRDAVPSYEHLSALRRTVDTPEALSDFLSYLSPHFSFPGHRARHALFHYSIACRDLGFPERAIFAARQRFLAGLKIVQFGEKPEPDKADWAGNAGDALIDLKSDLATIGVEFFLISGTLLGCIRENGILGHDKDIDVGVETHLPRKALEVALSTSGRFRLKSSGSENLIQIEHANGVQLDVFRHWREAGRVFHEGQKSRWWNTAFETTEIEFLGQTFRIPSDPDRYLTENYGSTWTIPQPDFETFVDTPNMIAGDPDHMTWYYYTRLHDYYYAGKPIQLRKVHEALKTLVPHDYPVSLAVEAVLEKHRRAEADL